MLHLTKNKLLAFTIATFLVVLLLLLALRLCLGLKFSSTTQVQSDVRGTGPGQVWVSAYGAKHKSNREVRLSGIPQYKY